MPTRFVCLANSFKEGGRCLAGIELDTNNNPKIVNGHPKWIRPICNTPHGEVHNHLVSHIKILNIVEVEITNYPEKNDYQSENAYFRENSLRVIGNYEIIKLDKLCDNRNLIFENRGKAVSEEAIENTTFSLMFIKVTKFKVIEKTYADKPNKPQIRLVFSFNNNEYDLPITDPVFLHRYQTTPDFLENYNKLYISLSLAVEWKGWYYKLIAGIIL
ncbi:MAG: hypothetical protein WBP45_06530 [Daejeonella sp.]